MIDFEYEIDVGKVGLHGDGERRLQRVAQSENKGTEIMDLWSTTTSLTRGIMSFGCKALLLNMLLYLGDKIREIYWV